jgi:hypothetical protein
MSNSPLLTAIQYMTAILAIRFISHVLLQIQWVKTPWIFILHI